MYSGLDKSGGGLIGFAITKDGDVVSLAEAAEEASVEETLVAGSLDDTVPGSHYQASMNPEDGELLWNSIDINESLYKTISMSQMSSMLKDNDRNLIYSKAIEKCIKNFKLKHDNDNDNSPLVLDIGTGTGLLACLCIRHGAKMVTGCEMFESMAMIANKVVEDNNMSDSIQILPCKSTMLSFSVKSDILVSELLDSMLLGEACLLSHSDAIKRLIKNDDDDNDKNIIPIEERIVPNRGKCYMTLIDTSTSGDAKSQDYQDVKNIFGMNEGGRMELISPFRNETDAYCGAGCQGLPIHWEHFKDHFDAKPLSAASEVCIVSFTQVVEEEKEVHTTKVNLIVTRKGTLDCVLMWWELYLLSTEIDPKGECMYSTEPRARMEINEDKYTEGNKQGWQDHWVQIIFPLPAALVCQVNEGDEVVLTVCRDTLHFWIADAKVENRRVSRKRSEPEPESKLDLESISPSLLPKACQCGWHLLLNPLRILQLNTTHKKMQKAMMDCIAEVNNRFDNEDGVLLDVSDGSRLALMLLRYITDGTSLNGLLQVASVERKQLSRMLHYRTAEATMKTMESNSSYPFVKNKPRIMVWDGGDYSDLDYFCHNKEDKEDEEHEENEKKDTNKDGDIPPAPILALVSDGYYYQLHKMPTWGAIRFMYIRHSAHVKSRLLPNAVISPQKARIMVAAVSVPDLWRSYGHVGEAMGFDHTCLDRVQEDWYQNWFPFQIGEYEHFFLHDPVEMITFDYVTKDKTTTSTGDSLGRLKSKFCNSNSKHTFDAVVMWVEYDHNVNVSNSLHENNVNPCRLSLEKPTLVRFNQKQEELTGCTHVKYSSLFTWGDSDVQVAATLFKEKA